jgi:hypothetical protein
VVGGDSFGVRGEGLGEGGSAGDGFGEELRDLGGVLDVGGPAGVGLVEDAANVSGGMDGGENGLAGAEVVVEFGGYVDGVVGDEEEVVGLGDVGEGLGLGEEADEFELWAEAEEGVAVRGGFDVADETEAELGADLGREGGWLRLPGWGRWSCRRCRCR